MTNLLSRLLFGHAPEEHVPDPDLKHVTDRLDKTEHRLTLIETEIKVIKGDVG